MRRRRTPSSRIADLPHAVPRFTLGCAGWSYPDWRGNFYPRGASDGDELARYARVFDLVEVNSAYYDAPRADLVARWARLTPPGFRFSVKFPEAIASPAGLAESAEPTARLLSALTALDDAGKLGPLVLQMPPSFRREAHHQALHDFLTGWPTRRPLAIELRHKSWWHADTYRLLESARACLVWSVTHYGRTPPVLTTDWGYLRLIGDRELTRFHKIQRDHTPEIDHWRARIAEEGERAHSWHLIVNNHFMGHGPSSAALVASRFGLPAPDLAAAARQDGQRGLLDFS